MVQVVDMESLSAVVGESLMLHVSALFTWSYVLWWRGQKKWGGSYDGRRDRPVAWWQDVGATFRVARTASGVTVTHDEYSSYAVFSDAELSTFRGPPRCEDPGADYREMTL